MFENMNPLDSTTAFFEIAVLLLISFIIGFVAARIPIPGSASVKNNGRTKKGANKIEEEEIDPRDIITEPTTIKAVLTRDRKGNRIAPVETKQTKTIDTKIVETPPARIAAIKRDYSSKAKNSTKKD